METERFIQTSIPGLYRDTHTGAIINRNVSELNNYLLMRDRLVQQNEIDHKVEDLVKEINEIKSLIKELVNKNNG